MSDPYLMNRLGNCGNYNQGGTKKVLCVCSAGLLRSPTAAVVLSQPPFNYNTRAAGLEKQFALIPVDQVLLEWADEIVCMDEDQLARLRALVGDNVKPIINLNIMDSFRYRDEGLMWMIRSKYETFLQHRDEEQKVAGPSAAQEPQEPTPRRERYES